MKGLRGSFKRMIALLITTGISSFILWSFSYQPGDDPEASLNYHHNLPSKPQTDQKLILLWDSFADFSLVPGSSLFKEWKCPETRCSFSTDRSQFPDTSAVLFHMRETTRPSQLPKHHLSKRRRDQRWVFVMKEPPVYSSFDPASFHHVFNWTMTYQRNSDIVWPYGTLYKRPNVLKKLPDYHEQKKGSREILWVVSRCKSDSRREQFVKQLQQHIPIDIYGKCGSLSCTRSGNHSCEEILKNYHFYLAFENSMCPDYVTEKLYKVLTQKDSPAIPIVLGGADYEALLPTKSFISAGRYRNRTQEFAEYLKKVISNRKMYNEFHDWRRTFLVSAWGSPQGFCNLCDKLHNDDSPKSYSGEVLRQFWDKSKCERKI